MGTKQFEILLTDEIQDIIDNINLDLTSPYEIIDYVWSEDFPQLEDYKKILSNHSEKVNVEIIEILTEWKVSKKFPSKKQFQTLCTDLEEL